MQMSILLMNWRVWIGVWKWWLWTIMLAMRSAIEYWTYRSSQIWRYLKWVIIPSHMWKKWSWLDWIGWRAWWLGRIALQNERIGITIAGIEWIQIVFSIWRIVREWENWRLVVILSWIILCVRLKMMRFWKWLRWGNWMKAVAPFIMLHWHYRVILKEWNDE